MNKTSPIAAAVLLGLVVLASRADAQATAPAANPNSPAAIRAARIKAAQAAAAAAAKAPPTATTPPVITPPPPTAPPVNTTAAPKTTASAPAASSSVKPATSAAPATSAVALPTHTDTAAIALDLEALKKTRPDRRHAEFVDLQARFGGLLSDPRALAELKQHAQRIAYLQRVRALGVKANDANFVKGVDALITTEETRDANTLNSFRTGALPVPTAAATATAVAVPVAAPAAGATK